MNRPEYRTERIGAVMVDMLPLLPAHRAEVNWWPEVPQQIDWNRYLQATERGHYSLTTCRLAGELIGWIGFWIATHTRHQSMNMAREDWYYLMPEHRGQGWGRELFVQAEQNLLAAGVDRITMSCKVNLDHSQLITSLGYTEYERHFTKKLEPR
jgi:GNAT superfamily N-acetyltransferase